MNRSKYFIVAIAVLTVLATFFLITFQKFKAHEEKIDNKVYLTDQIDPDIVLINMGDGDRTSIGNLLLKIDSCKPTLIAVDAWFIKEKDSFQDSVLINALKKIQNDLLAYTTDSTGNLLKSHSKFRSLVSEEGLAISYEDELSTNMVPLDNIGGTINENFALKIIKYWKPSFSHNFKKDELIPVKFTRSLDQFVHYEGSKLEAENCKDLKNKIVLVGYLGPSNEDKHFTPMRRFGRFDADEPDTYGLVIIANEIRTILEYKK
jgi:hypothetical protein